MAFVTVTPMPDATPPRMRVQLGWDTTTEVTVSRRDTDRSRPVWGAEPLSVDGGTGPLLYDYECPFGLPVVYEATGADGTFAVSESTVLSPTAFYPNAEGWSTERGAVWLRHLTNPVLSMPIDLANAESPVFKQTRSVVDVLNRRTPIVVSDGRRKELTSTLDVRTWSLDEAAQLRALCADNSVLLLTVPAAERWGITQWYVSVGDLTEERLWQEWAPFEGRVFHLPVEVVDRPAGGNVYAECSYWSIGNGVPSYLALAENHNNYAALASCTAYVDLGGDGGQQPDPPLAEYRSTSNLGTLSGTTVTANVTFAAEADTTYSVRAEHQLIDAAQPVTWDLRYQYGSSVGPSIGQSITSNTVASIPADSPAGFNPPATLHADSAGDITIVLVITAGGTVTDYTGPDYPRFLTIRPA